VQGLVLWSIPYTHITLHYITLHHKCCCIGDSRYETSCIQHSSSSRAPKQCTFHLERATYNCSFEARRQVAPPLALKQTHCNWRRADVTLFLYTECPAILCRNLRKRFLGYSEWQMLYQHVCQSIRIRNYGYPKCSLAWTRWFGGRILRNRYNGYVVKFTQPNVIVQNIFAIRLDARPCSSDKRRCKLTKNYRVSTTSFDIEIPLSTSPCVHLVFIHRIFSRNSTRGNLMEWNPANAVVSNPKYHYGRPEVQGTFQFCRDVPTEMRRCSVMLTIHLQSRS
jgi:hypothetical protein